MVHRGPIVLYADMTSASSQLWASVCGGARRVSVSEKEGAFLHSRYDGTMGGRLFFFFPDGGVWVRIDSLSVTVTTCILTCSHVMH